MRCDKGAAEIVGVILLIGIIIGTFAIFGALYIPTLKPDANPQVKLNIACGSFDIFGDNDLSDYPCIRGAFGCRQFDNHTCEEDCRYRDYAENPQYNSENSDLEVLRCKENCEGTICSELTNCKFLYVCHNGGDSLQISDLNIVINGITLSNKESWKLKQDEIIYLDPSEKQFQNGNLLLIPNSDYTKPIDTVMILYTLVSGREVPLVMNQYGTDTDR